MEVAPPVPGAKVLWTELGTSQGELNALGPLMPEMNLGHWEFTWGPHCPQVNLFEKSWLGVE